MKNLGRWLCSGALVFVCFALLTLLMTPLEPSSFAFAGTIAKGTSQEDSSMVQQEDRAKVGETAETWNIHGRATVIPQSHASFYSAIPDGTNSLISSGETQTSYTATLFLGARAWKNSEFYFDPEMTGGSGLSQTKGLAGFSNGEIYRVDTPTPKVTLARLYLRQDFTFGGEQEWIASDKNQLAGKKDVSRFTFIGGKFSLNDFFDDNTYSHDPRTQFLNWALMDTGAWDYAADTRGYTYGIYLELNQPIYAIRFASVLEPGVANQMDMDLDVRDAHSENLEGELRYKIADHPGKTRLLAYWNHARMGNYRQALALSPVNPDITATRSYSSKYGFALNLEQEIAADLGGFARLGWNDGATETWAFTEIDRSIAVGLSLKGTRWFRPDDTFGLAEVINFLSSDHADYLRAGGLGFIIGDGSLTYAAEEILETYYSWQIAKAVALSGDYQFVSHPAYNQDRGPVSIFALRAHFEL